MDGHAASFPPQKDGPGLEAAREVLQQFLSIRSWRFPNFSMQCCRQLPPFLQTGHKADPPGRWVLSGYSTLLKRSPMVA